MRTSLSWKTIGLFALGVFAGSLTVTPAGNQWSSWHWERVGLKYHNAGSASHWRSVFDREAGDWDAASCFAFSSGSAGDYDIRAFERNAGASGWLGIATIEAYSSDSHGWVIERARTELNTYYMDGASYGDDWDAHVTCQEFGHDLGLDHVKGPRKQSCMNDQGFGPFPDFNDHDISTLCAITAPGGTLCSGDSACGGGEPGDPGGGASERKCRDGADNDGDGLIDCQDPDCAGKGGCK